MTNTTPCPKCGRQINNSSHTHKKFCDKIPPPNILEKCHRMPLKMMSIVWGVSEKHIGKHIDKLDIDICKGDICVTCGLRIKNKHEIQHEGFCSTLYQNLPDNPLEAREELQRVVDDYTFEEMSKMYFVPAGSIRQHLQALGIEIPSKIERAQRKAYKAYDEIISNISMPRENIQEALKYFGMRQVADELEFTHAMTKPILKRMGMRIYTKSEVFYHRNCYKKVYGCFPELYDFLGRNIYLSSEKCKRCEMEIYEDMDSLPDMALVMDAKGNHNRTLPSFVNRWTQQAIPLERDRFDLRWQRLKDEVTKKREWRFFDDKVMEWYKVGELLCRFCIADLKGQTAPLPPDEYKVINGIVETTTDNDGYFDDFEDIDEVIYE